MRSGVNREWKNDPTGFAFMREEIDLRIRSAFPSNPAERDRPSEDEHKCDVRRLRIHASRCFANRSSCSIENREVKNLKWRCVPGGIRTPNLLIRSQLLYPVELQTHFGSEKGPVASDKFKSNLFRLPAVTGPWLLLKAGWSTGLEPATTRTTIWGSTIELRPPLLPQKQDFKI